MECFDGTRCTCDIVSLLQPKTPLHVAALRGWIGFIRYVLQRFFAQGKDTVVWRLRAWLGRYGAAGAA